MKPRALFFILLALLALASVSPAAAQGVQPPAGSAWGEVIDANGNILYDHLTDLGEIQVDADWMPDVPFIDGQATYHQYVTPSGNVVVMPSASTLFFMSLNPTESGLDGAQSMLGNGMGVLEMMLGGYITPGDITGAGYSNPDDFYQAVIDGSANLWTFDFMGNLLWDLMTSSMADQNLYTMLLLYSPGNCASVPGGCPPGLQNLLTTPPPPADITCPAPFITTSPIVITGGAGSGQGVKIAPLKPVVVGQDPEMRGVDIQVNATISPVIYHTFEKVRHEALGCISVPSGGTGCPDHPGNRYYNTRVEVWYECKEHTQTYTDNLASAQVFVNLTQASRQWILTELAQAYPDAHLINPDFTFTFGSGGSSWSMVIPRLQTADPGAYAVTVAVRTTGTPVSGPRSARLGVGQFNVELVRVRLIEAP